MENLLTHCWMVRALKKFLLIMLILLVRGLRMLYSAKIQL